MPLRFESLASDRKMKRPERFVCVLGTKAKNLSPKHMPGIYFSFKGSPLRGSLSATLKLSQPRIHLLFCAAATQSIFVVCGNHREGPTLVKYYKTETHKPCWKGGLAPVRWARWLSCVGIRCTSRHLFALDASVRHRNDHFQPMLNIYRLCTSFTLMSIML